MIMKCVIWSTRKSFHGIRVETRSFIRGIMG